MKKIILKCLIVFIVLLTQNAFGQNNIKNIITTYDVDRDVIEISFDLEGAKNDLIDIDVDIREIEKNKLIAVPSSIITPSLRFLSPGNIKFEIPIKKLKIHGDFLPELRIVNKSKSSSGSNDVTNLNISAEKREEVADRVKISTPNDVSLQDDTSVKTNTNPQIINNNLDKEYIPEQNIKPKEIYKGEQGLIKGVIIKGKSLNELSRKMKEYSSEMMLSGDLMPVNLNLDLNKLTFQCDFKLEQSGLIKLGLYFGPIVTGCVSCLNVISNNPGSKILKSGKSRTVEYQVIGIGQTLNR